MKKWFSRTMAVSAVWCVHDPMLLCGAVELVSKACDCSPQLPLKKGVCRTRQLGGNSGLQDVCRWHLRLPAALAGALLLEGLAGVCLCVSPF